MADDRNNQRSFVRQSHGVGHPSPPLSTPDSGSSTGGSVSSRSAQKENSPPRGPRTLLLRRSENGYGFTLRHFIVYPPESCCMLPGHERTKIDEPMDTIFVKQVRANSPAAEAGLRTGDRVVSVDGVPTRGEQYASVVQRIQQAGPWLRLLVVSKEDDILQRYFGETAHNPETNQRPRLCSPERLSQKQRRSISMIPASSPRTRQSWVCSLSSSENSNHHEEAISRSQQVMDGRMPPTAMIQFPPIAETQITSVLQQRRDAQSEADALHDLSKDPRVPGRKLHLLRDGLDALKPNSRLSQDSKYDLYDRTRPESVYSRPSNEQLYDRINDPIYERVRVSEHHPSQHHYYQPSLLRYPMSQAEPQVPIYRPNTKRMVLRRASEGSGTANDSETTSYSSIDALRSSECRLSIESRRDSSPAASKDSTSPYDSTSTLTGNECSDDSVIMNRLRKSFEQKAEFLRRPSHPIGWSIDSSSPPPPPLLSNFQAAVIQREFYARPQKLQRSIWPPGQCEQPSPTRRSQERSLAAKPAASLLNKPSNQNVQRIKDVDSNSEYSKSRNDQQLEDNQSAIADHCYSSLPYDNELAKEQQYRSANKSNLVSILSRIHENITASQQQTLQQDARNGSSSLPSSPGPDKKGPGDAKFPVPPQGLQIVSKRAKQFESGRLMSDEDEPAGDRTNLYKSELSRLSNKRSVPNVAVRKREFESKAESHEPRRMPNRETKSLDTGAVLTGNRTIPIGSKYIHCEPPADYRESKEVPIMETESVRLRARSNSAESWEATNGPAARSCARHTWQIAEEESGVEDNDKSSRKQATVNGSSSNGSATNNAIVLRRQKNAQISDEDRATRRVSYLKATWGERMHVDSDLELSDSEPVHIRRSEHRRWRPPLFPSDITPLRRIFEDMTQAASLHRNSHHRNSIAVTHNNNGDGTAKDLEPVEREGTLHVKFTVLDGKRSSDRSWKQVWGVLRGPVIYFYKDRHSQSPSLSTESETSAGQSIDVRCSVVDVAEDYTKRKHVLRVANPTAEVLLQTEDAASMALWLRSLHSHAAAEKSSDAVSCTSKQQAVPQTPTGSISPSSGVPSNNSQRLSPLPSHKGIKKLTSFRNRSPTGQSPVNKTRKPSTQVMESLASPKSKTWKGRMAKQFRRMHGQAGGAPSSPTAQLPPEGATFKMPLELCPPSSFSEYVPLIVEMCTSIVEARGLEVVGIYRVPGNTAAIAQLTDSVNRGFENINLQDPRWSDVNVISSLLKSFFRQLPDSLLTADLYPMFIDADKIEDPQRRMTTIRKLLRDLPEHHFETLKYLMQHLKKVVEHSEINKMEAKNLAIVFGPTLVRASGSRDNMVTMVTDMSHQCRIVESLLNNVDWFFSEDDLDDLSRLSVNLNLPVDTCEVEPPSANHSLLLNNIQKIEGMRDMASARDIVSSIISAANKKIQRRRKNQDEIDNGEHDNDKAKSKQESENLPTIRQSMALNERQCSVSEIVQMHESKNQSNQSAERSERSLSIDANNGSSSNRASPSYHRFKYMNQSAPSSIDSPRLSSETGSSLTETSATTTESSASNETKQSNDEIAILTYAGLSATTQERVRKFEEETKAMLQRDQHRQRLEAEKMEEERRRIEIEWQLAKREMENDDLLDSIVDTTVSPSLLSERLSGLNERFGDKSLIDLSERRPRSNARPSLSIAVQQQPTIYQKAQATNQLTSVLGEKMNNGVIKKFKTDKDPSMESICLPPVRYGSLDSLHEVHNFSQSSPSPSQQQRGVPGDISDDGPGSAAPKTPPVQSPMSVPVPVAAVPMPMPVPVSVPAATAAAATATATAAPALATAVASAAVPPSSVSSSAPSSSSSPRARDARSANNEPAAVPGSGLAATTAKTLNRFLRGSDLLTSLTTTFDRKWRSLVNQSSNQAQTPLESASCNRDDAAEQQQQQQKSNASPKFKYPTSMEAYRDPSLHKSLEKSHLSRTKNDTPEKDTDSTITDDTSHPLKSVTPNNDLAIENKPKTETKTVPNHATERTTLTEKTLDFGKKDRGGKDSDEGEVCLRVENAKCYELTSERNIQEALSESNDVDAKFQDNGKGHHYEAGDSNSYSNKLKKFESLTNSEARSRLKRSESLNKRTPENTTARLKRSESLNKHSTERLSPLKRSESLNKHSGDRSESPGSKLKRSESLTKTEKTECNISKRRQAAVRKESATKLKRKNGMSERSIKRRHTVGGTKDFDKVHWLDNKLQSEAERIIRSDYRPKKSQLRTSSPDLSTNRVNVADTSFLIEVSFRGPSNVVFNVTNAARPQSLPDANLASKVFKVPLESHV